MSPVFAARRRADEFDKLVERGSTGVDDARYSELLDLVGALRTATPAQPRAEFVASLRERLMAAAETELVPLAATPADKLALAPRRTARERRLVAAVGGLAIVGATSSMAVAAQSALPGDLLYPLKRAIENAHEGFSFGDNAKGHTLLANATGRLDEVDQLVDAQGTDPAVISQTLLDFAEQARDGSGLMLDEYQATGDPETLAALQTFIADSLAALDQMSPMLPEESQAALVSAGQLLADIDDEIVALCPTCDDVVTEIPQWLLAATSTTTESVTPAVQQGDRRRTRNDKPKDRTTSSAQASATPSQEPVTTEAGGTPTPPAPTGSPSEDPLGPFTAGTSEPSGLPGLPDPTSALSGVGDAVSDAVEGIVP